MNKSARLAIVCLLSGLAVAPAGESIAKTVKQSIAECAVVEGDLDRLACFDRMAKDMDLDGPQPQPVSTDDAGKWVINKDRNPVDDTEQVTIVLIADEGSSRLTRQPVAFVARCRSNKTEAYINWHDYLASDSGSIRNQWKHVTIRIGSAEAERQRWGVSTDGKATFAPSWPGDLLKRMAGANRFLAQVTPYNESPVTAIFDTTGMKNALEPLAKACNWDLE